MMNYLMCSVGRRGELLKDFRKSIPCGSKLVATDNSKYAPALYMADVQYLVPKISDPGYIDKILEICQKEQITGVLSLIDPELSLLAENIDRFKEIGTTVIGGSYDLCEMALDKMQMYNWLKGHGYNCAKSYIDKDAFYKDLQEGKASFPVFVKPVLGSASIAINKVEDKDTLELLWTHGKGLMIQEYLKEQEIGADVYIDMVSHEVVSIFTKKKLVMRAGETDKAVSFKDPELFALIEKFALECGWNGQIDIDIFEINGRYYISEVNPRFGGGYPHAYECGCNHMKLIENNIEGRANQKNIGAYEEGIYMMKYNEVKIVKKG